jgi:predicted Zn-dependent protease
VYPASLTDGRSAARRPVTVQVTMGRLVIIGEDGETIDEWPLEGLRLADEIHREGQPVRLAHSDRGEARLTFESQEILRALGEVPGAGRKWSWGKRIAVYAGIAVAALGIIIGAAIAVLPWAADRLSLLVPAGLEDAAGVGIMAAIAARYPECRSHRGEAALASLARRLAAGHRATGNTFRNPVRVRVFRSKIPNAFTAPGGHIGIFAGLFRHARTPGELAGVLAHEMGHAALRHPEKSILRRAGLGLIFAAMTGDAAELAAWAGKLTRNLLNLSFTREAELEADREAIAMLAGAGIRPDGLSRFLGRIARRAPGMAEGGYFSTHPAARDRVAAMSALTKPAGPSRSGPAMTQAEWESIRGICANTGSW